MTQTFLDVVLKWYIWPFLGYLCSYKYLCQRYWLKGVYGTSKLPKFYRNDFKHDSYCCVGFKWPRKIHLNTQWLPPPDWNKVNLIFIIWWVTGPVPHVPERSGDPAILQRGEQEQQHQRETISVPSNKHVLLSCAWHKTPGRVECSLFFMSESIRVSQYQIGKIVSCMLNQFHRCWEPLSWSKNM